MNYYGIAKVKLMSYTREYFTYDAQLDISKEMAEIYVSELLSFDPHGFIDYPEAPEMEIERRTEEYVNTDICGWCNRPFTICDCYEKCERCGNKKLNCTCRKDVKEAAIHTNRLIAKTADPSVCEVCLNPLAECSCDFFNIGN